VFHDHKTIDAYGDNTEAQSSI
jgi:hypothetical protein